MGKHFDNLINLTKSNIETDGRRLKHPRKYLESLLRRASLFDLPYDVNATRPECADDNEAYARYVNDYIQLSHQYGVFLALPYDVIAIEDFGGLIVFDTKGPNQYRMTSSITTSIPQETHCVFISDLELSLAETGNVRSVTDMQYGYVIIEGEEIPSDVVLSSEMFSENVSKVSRLFNHFIQDLIYIMDPDNFIIRKEHKQAQRYREKQARGKGKLAKTIMRPHYVCYSEEDTKEFLQDVAKEPRPAHPVRGHWRRLISEKFINKRGQRIFIKQYFTGEGEIEGKEGWNYQVFVKEDPVSLVAYRNKEFN